MSAIPVDKLENEVMTVPERAKSLAIATAEDYVKAGELLKVIRALRLQIDETFNPIVSKAWDAHREALAQKRKVEAPLAEAEWILKPRMASYVAEEERLRKQEELRLQKLAQEEAERQQLADASLLHDIGETDQANALLNEKPVVAPVIVPRRVPSVQGVTTRQTWHAEVTNLLQLVQAVAAGKAPIQCLNANAVFLNQMARSMKQTLNYPGVRAVPDNNISVRR